jgi:hypothetical protein
MEKEPAVLFDALVLPDGAAGVNDLQRFIKSVARHRHPERETDPPRV